MSAQDANRTGAAEAEQRRQQEARRRVEREVGIEPSPPPYESAETPLERLGPGFAYLGGVIGGAFLLNKLLLLLIAVSNGS